jgi:hypothetical protein
MFSGSSNAAGGFGKACPLAFFHSVLAKNVRQDQRGDCYLMIDQGEEVSGWNPGVRGLKVSEASLE